MHTHNYTHNTLSLFMLFMHMVHVSTCSILSDKQIQIEAEFGFPEWSDPMKISVPFDLPDSREGIYIHTLSIIYMETTCIHVTTVEWFYIVH